MVAPHLTRGLSRRVVYAAVAALLAFLLTACATSRGVAPPEFSAANAVTSHHLSDLQTTRDALSGDLEQLRRLQALFVKTSPSLLTPEFPLALHKFVLMSCLNQEWSPPPDEGSKERTRCSPPLLDALIQSLDEGVTERRHAALQQLEIIDEARRLRGELKARLGALPDRLQADRLRLADQRAELRQVRAELHRRKANYSPSAWQTAQSRLEERQALLDEVELAIARLERAAPQWAILLNEQLNTLYMDVSALGS